MTCPHCGAVGNVKPVCINCIKRAFPNENERLAYLLALVWRLR